MHQDEEGLRGHPPVEDHLLEEGLCWDDQGEGGLQGVGEDLRGGEEDHQGKDEGVHLLGEGRLG